MYTVLICDDDEAILESVRIYLDNEGYKVLTACDGEDSFKNIKSKKRQGLTLPLIFYLIY